ncbi:prepilin-type N-terminal cleavage/methylation domain-containing protein [Desulfobulbus elongatus]|uniref:prepilin-type N-terminal cleavage/methylation domain-containing protein n=1 Tax=Desulfobulbus elongatus TaxID=53332 RepID=UPI000555D63A|nr:prepilin-type N-terminal cleavage/methylation domain-containing protein [Desulfobulbus elongatus]
MKAFAQKMKTLLETRKQMLESKKRNNDGFTLLELLVVVAILAAIAGTATIALQDTDARAAAAAHVAMMDELNKGVGTFRVLQKNVLPNNLDSLLSHSGTDFALLPNGNGEILGIENDGTTTGDIGAFILPADSYDRMEEIGMTHLRYINADAATNELPDDVTSCAVANGNLQNVINSRSNAVVAGNIFNGPEGNGCGESVAMDSTATVPVALWTGTAERILGPGDYGSFQVTAPDIDTAPAAIAAAALQGTARTATAGVPAPIMMAVGFGPASDLFNVQKLGAMTSVPVYRHVNPDQYNRFIGLFQVATAISGDAGAYSSGTIEAVDMITFLGVVDGAGDTKEEELGEWDGTRSTI